MNRSKNSLTRGHHCVYDIHYHFVFAVKYRRALLDEEVVEYLKYLIVEIQERYDIIVECFGADKNHIHLLCSAHPKMSPGDITRIFKSITARELFLKFPLLKKSLWGGEFWTDGYFVATASKRGDFDTLTRYIQNQGQEPENVNLRLLFEPALGEADDAH